MLCFLCRRVSPTTELTTMTLLWASWRLKSRASRLFTQPFIQEQIKENIFALFLNVPVDNINICEWLWFREYHRCYINWCHVIIMTSSNGNIFRVDGPLWEESTGDRWVPLTKGQCRRALFALMCIEQTVEQTTQMTVIRDTFALIMTSL